MRIAVWHNLPSGGGKRALYYHVRGLVERGHTVESWCPPTADQSYLPLGDLIPEHIFPLEDSEAPSSPLRGILLSRRYPIGRLLWEYYATVDRLATMDRHCRMCAEQINAGGFDVLFANCCMFHRAPAIGRYVNLPKMLYLQEPYRWLYEAMPTLPWAALPEPGSRLSPRYLHRRVADSLKVNGLRVQVREELANAKAYDTILVNSRFSRESVLRAYGLDSRVCYLGVDTTLFAGEDRPRENFVIGLGAFVAEKNLRLAIEALARLPAPRPKLVWVGNVATDYREQMIQLSESLGVCFEPLLGVSDGELVGLLGRASAMVYAPRLEPFGFAPLEANACGTPVVAVAEGGVRETVVDGVNGLLVDHDPRSMADALGRLLSDPGYARRLGEGGRRLVSERWSLTAAIDRLEAQLETLVGCDNSFRSVI